MEHIKRKRGRPKKNVEVINTYVKNEQQEIKEENIILFLAISDEFENDTHTGDPRYETLNTQLNISPNIKNIDILDNSKHDTKSSSIFKEVVRDCNRNLNRESDKDKHMVKNQIGESLVLNNIHKIQTTVKKKQPVEPTNSVGSETKLVRSTDIKCMWCNEKFHNIPACIVDCIKNDTFYGTGNYCSFNCAMKYNFKVIKDYKCQTRYALTHKLKTKIMNNSDPIIIAKDRELLKTNGGNLTISEFRNDSCIILDSMYDTLPEIILHPLQ